MIRRFCSERGGERKAISLAPRLQPGDSKPELTKEPFLTVFVGRKHQEKPLETVQGIIL
jgi:hypothetical protein